MISTDKMTTEKETEMKTFKCEEMMCGGCVNRIKKGLDAADIKNKVDLDSKTVTIDGCGSCEAKAVEILDGLGFSAVEV
jgi:copper chaperone